MDSGFEGTTTHFYLIWAILTLTNYAGKSNLKLNHNFAYSLGLDILLNESPLAPAATALRFISW
jgi:hypothetical protein